MTINAGTEKLGPVGTAVLERLAALEVGSISPDDARQLLDFRFSAAHQERFNAFSKEAQAGTLSAAEQDDLDEYIRVGDLVAILQSRARRALKNAGAAP